MKQSESLDAVTILLAAGSSSRMGQSKQLLDMGGVPLLRRSAQVALDSQSPKVIVVLGANEETHREALGDLPVEIVVNHYWKSGMGSSIKTGLRYVISEHEEAKAVLIMVCDQPALTAAHLNTLLDSYVRSQKKIAASGYDGTVGVPAVFGRAFFSNMLMLQDDQGAKKIISQFPEQVISIPFPDGSIDLDTIADYQKYIEGKNR